MRRCWKCQRIVDLRESHVCPPAWDVVDETDPSFVGLAYGADADAAAEHYAEYVWGPTNPSDDEGIITVAVRPAAGSAPWVFRKIARDWEPVYSASETARPDDWGISAPYALRCESAEKILRSPGGDDASRIASALEVLKGDFDDALQVREEMSPREILGALARSIPDDWEDSSS